MSKGLSKADRAARARRVILALDLWMMPAGVARIVFAEMRKRRYRYHINTETWIRDARTS